MLLLIDNGQTLRLCELARGRRAVPSQVNIQRVLAFVNGSALMVLLLDAALDLVLFDAHVAHDGL